MFGLHRQHLVNEVVLFAMGVTIIGCAQGTSPNAERPASPTLEHRDLQPSRNKASPATQRAQLQPGFSVKRSTLLVRGQKLSLHTPIGRKAPLPAVLVFHSARGRTESVLQACDRLASHGIAAAALDFYDGKVAATHDEAMSLRDSANSHAEDLVDVVRQAYDQLQREPVLQSKCRFLLGGSFGGAWATFAAGFLPDVQGVVAFYGEALTDSPGLYEKLRAPVLLIGAERDTNPTPDQLSRIVGLLRDHEQHAELLMLPAEHGFIEHGHPGYDRGAAEAAWLRAIGFLDEQPCTHLPKR